jgi:hypothetical protein
MKIFLWIQEIKIIKIKIIIINKINRIIYDFNYNPPVIIWFKVTKELNFMFLMRLFKILYIN